MQANYRPSVLWRGLSRNDWTKLAALPQKDRARLAVNADWYFKTKSQVQSRHYTPHALTLLPIPVPLILNPTPLATRYP